MANLWYAAAKALGFVVLTLCYPDPLFVGHLTRFCEGAKSLEPPPGHLRRPSQLPDFVFSDLAGLPLGPDAAKYWDAWTTTRMFYCLGVGDSISSLSNDRGVPLLRAPPPPRGWTARSVCLAHSDTGGSTSGRWSFVMWYPPGLPWVETLTWEPRVGTPLLCCMNDREYARLFLGPRGSGAAGASVVRVEGLVMDFGLFPASDPSAQVVVESSSSPSGYGLHRLTARELGNLWDVPILFLNSLSKAEVGALTGAICASPPSKLLHTGADLLLTAVFRGGGVGSVSGKGSAREPSGPPGPHPLSDRELRIKRVAPDKASPGEKRPRVEVPPQDKVSTEVSTAVEVIKGNSQKGDNASVPDHLWLRAFVIGYGDEACAERHREALTLLTGDVRALGTSEPPAGWRGAIPGLRLFVLRYWRGHMTRGYISWQKTNVPLPPGSGGQMVQYRWQASKCPVYEWTARGRRLYQAEWRTAGCTRRGVQDASHKRTSPSQTPGPWASTVTHTDGGKVCGMVSQEKWDKSKRLIAELGEMVALDCLPLTRLLQIRGFLMYVVRTYPWINPYIKGLHLTIDSWQPFRGPDGFKLSGKELASVLTWDIDGAMPCRRAEDDPEIVPEAGNAHKREGRADEPPVHVTPAPRFLQDLKHLSQLIDVDTPPRQLYQAKHSTALFVIGDASDRAKGSVVMYQHGLDYELGTWSEEWRGKSTSLTALSDWRLSQSGWPPKWSNDWRPSTPTMRWQTTRSLFSQTRRPSRGPTTRATRRAGSSATLCFDCIRHSGREGSYYMSYTSWARG